MNGCLLPIVINLHIVCSGASCRIRTNDPEITNHVLWPTELKRRVGKLLASRRYNLLPLLRSRPGGFEGSWPYKTCPFCGCKGNKKREKGTYVFVNFAFFNNFRRFGNYSAPHGMNSYLTVVQQQVLH